MGKKNEHYKGGEVVNLYFDIEKIASLFNISSYMLWILGYRHGWVAEDE